MSETYRPYTLVAELTYKCPLRCVYCSNPLDYGRHDRELVGQVLGEDRPHVRLRGRAFHHDHKLRLVGGGAHQAPSSILEHDPDAVDGD